MNMNSEVFMRPLKFLWVIRSFEALINSQKKKKNIDHVADHALIIWLIIH